MRVRAGLITTSPVWEILLAQEGFPWKVLRSPYELNVENFSVVLADELKGKDWEEAVKAYIEKGGAAVVSQEDFSRLVDGRCRLEQFKYLVPAQGSVLNKTRFIDIPGRALVHERGGELQTEKGSMALPVLPYGNGMISTLPFDLDRYIRDTRGRRKLFSSPVAPLPSERVSRVPKGRLRSVVQSVLEALHHARGISHVHLWYFPGTLSNVFGLRIDTDYSYRNDVQRLYSLIKELELPATWFLHVKDHIGWIRDFVSMEGQEIGVHCYAHEVYGSSGLNRLSIAKARDLLLGAGIDPVGFAAPYGIWGEELPVDLEGLGFLYSSEFGFDYDNFVSFPLIGGEISSILHVPVHPISPGRLARDGYQESDMVRYYAAVMERKLAVHEPIFFYTHPGDGHFDLLRSLFDRVGVESVKAMTFSEYARWWLERERILKAIDITVKEDEIDFGLDDGEPSQGIRAAIVAPGRKWSLVRLQDRVDLRGLEWHDTREPVHEVGGEITVSGQRTRRLLEDVRTYLWRRRE